MTNGGPEILTLVLYLYAWKNAFEFFNMGYAQAIALFIAVLVFTISFVEYSILFLKPERK